MDPSSGADPVHLSQKSSRVGGGRTRPRRYSSILFRRSLPRHGTCGGIPFFTESLRMRRPDPLEAVLCRATSIRPRQFRDIVPGVFTPVLAKHSKSFSLVDCLSVGVDRMQRNFEPMRKQVEVWQRSELTDVTAKVVIYEAFIEGKLEAPKHLARSVHDLYFEPKYEDFRPRTIWSLSNAFTSALKELDPIPQFKATAKLGEFLEARFS
jgi:hypothetical protein